MSVTFIIGRAGSGKTHRCLTSIVGALKSDPLGPPIFWLLPRQATFSAERELTCNSGLEGFCRARVLSFEQLGHEIIAECGGASIPELTPLGRQMILGHLLRRNESRLSYFKNVARQPGLAAKLDATFGEFERVGKNAADLDLLLTELATGAADDEENIALLDKVHDLHLIYTAYTEYLGQDRLDQHQRLLHVLKCLDESKMFRRATVYVDGFHEFSEYERRVLARLGKVCQRVEIALLMDSGTSLLREPDLFPDQSSLFHPVEMAYRRLRMVFREEGVPVDEPPVILSHIHRFGSAGIQHVERSVFADSHSKGTALSHGIELVEAPNRKAEVDAAARRIKQLLRDGYRLRDIALLARNLSSYQELINASFREHGIRYFVDRRRETAHHPLLQFVRSVLILADQNWPHEWVMTLLKTELAGISPDDADALENYVLRHCIRGEQWESPDPWRFHAGGLLDHDDEPARLESASPHQIDASRRFIVEGLRVFREKTRRAAPVREIVAALFEVIRYFKVRETLAGWIGAAKEQEQFEWMEEHRRVWAETVELLDQMVELLGDERVRPEGFQEILEAGLQQFDLGLTPPTVDEVLVGQIDRTRTPDVKAVLVLGLCEGVFPSVPREDSVLCDADRRAFHRRNLDVSPTTDRRLLDENLLGYIAFTRASEVLYVSRSLADAKGKLLGPSVFWRRLTNLFPGLQPTVVPREERDAPSLIATPRQLVTSLMRWVRKAGDGLEDSATPWPALYQWLAAHPPDGSRMDAMRFGAWSALSHFNAAALSPDIAARLFASPLRAGVSQIETFASCPFKHFLRFGLNLHGRVDGDVTSLDLGNVYHQVLGGIVAALLQRRQSWADLTDKQRQKMIRDAADRIAHDLRGEVMLSTARNRYLMQRIERTLNQVVATQRAAAERGRFKPAYIKLRFGENAELPEYSLATPKNREVRLSGKIDRVDMAEAGSDFIVIDYRLGQNCLQLGDVFHGISLQLLVHMLVLEANGEAFAGRKLTPAAAFYVRMLRWMGKVDHPSEAISPDDPAFDLAVKPRGILDERIARDLDTSLESGASQVIYATIKKDGNFGSKAKSDLAAGDEFAALLEHARSRIAEIADQILDGEIGISPYMIGQKTPCPRCEYRGICRFENATGRYHHLTQMSREEVLIAVRAQDLL